MPRSRHATNAKPHQRAKADARVGQAAVEGDPWAARIRKAIQGSYHRWQRDAANDNSRRISVLTGRGAGKTTLWKGRLVDEMAHTTNGRYIYGCPTLGMAVELLWEPLKQLLSQLGLEQGHDYETKEAPREGGKILTLRTGSRLKLFGVDDAKQINLCRGQPFNGVVLDEAAYCGIALVKDFVENVIEPRIGERDGWIGLSSSPGRTLRGFFYDVTRDGSSLHRPYSQREQHPDWPRDAWSSHAWNLADITGIRELGDEPYPHAAAEYPALVALRQSHLRLMATKGWTAQNPVRLREYDGRWARDNTAAVFQFDPKINLWTPHGDRPIEGLDGLRRALAALPKEHEWHFAVSADKGKPWMSKDETQTGERERRDPWALNIYAFSPSDVRQRRLHVFFLERVGLHARPLAQLMLGADDKAMNGVMPHSKPGGIIGMIGWPDAMVADCDDSTIAELADPYGLIFEQASKNPNYKAGAIELTNGGLIDGRIQAIEDSPLHTQLSDLQWAEQESGALKEDPAQPNHSTDTLIYADRAIAKLFDSGVVTQETKKPAYSDPMGLDGPSESRTQAEPAPRARRAKKQEDSVEDVFNDWLSGQSDDGW